MLNTHWFKSPLEHWLAGLFAEIAALGAFLLVVWILAVLLMWVLQGAG